MPGASKQTTVGIVGTFDVENYGDLLFPLMAQAALSRRDRSVKILPFSPNSRSASLWPFAVYSAADIPQYLPDLSALLIGGGQLIRFDKGYPVAVDENSKLPLAYWLIPAALGAMIGKPVIWNAIGVWTDSPPAPWYDDVVATVLSASHFIGVRDEASQQHLAKTAPAVDIQLIPDTAFSISRVWPLQEESKEYKQWRASLGLEGRYIAIQAHQTLEQFRPELDDLLRKMGGIPSVILPICWCHGDRAERCLWLTGT